jgi:hypothetical protein
MAKTMVARKTVAEKDVKILGKLVEITLQPLKLKSFTCTIVGDTPLIVNRFTHKAIMQLNLKHQGIETGVTQQVRVPEQEAKDALYLTPDGKPGVPGGGLKKAIISACTSTNKKMSKTFLRQAFQIVGDIIPLKAPPYTVRMEDIGRVGMGKTPRPIYRPMFTPWEVTLKIVYNESIISPSQIVNMLNLAGFAVGFCEWRPEKSGTFGMFHVKEGNN